MQWGVWLPGTGKVLGWIPPQVCRKHQYRITCMKWNLPILGA